MPAEVAAKRRPQHLRTLNGHPMRRIRHTNVRKHLQPDNHTASVAKLPQSSYLRLAPLCRRRMSALVPQQAATRPPARHGNAHHR
ncbi:hypothetical protein CBM2629_B10448 [Cupriavidus taiwanensis]|nr:hypothetical protein CBM2629_B10448 [Cupriavidus taiwanensis]